MSESPKSLPSGLPKANSLAHLKMCLIISCFYASPFRSNISHRNLYSGLQPSFHSLITSRSGHIDIEWENEYLHHDFQISLKGNAGILHDPHIPLPLRPDNWSVTVDRTWIGEHPQGPNTWLKRESWWWAVGSPEHWTHLVPDMNEGHPRLAPFWQPNPFCFCERNTTPANKSNVCTRLPCWHWGSATAPWDNY